MINSVFKTTIPTYKFIEETTGLRTCALCDKPSEHLFTRDFYNGFTYMCSLCQEHYDIEDLRGPPKWLTLGEHIFNTACAFLKQEFDMLERSKNIAPPQPREIVIDDGKEQLEHILRSTEADEVSNTSRCWLGYDSNGKLMIIASSKRQKYKAKNIHHWKEIMMNRPLG